MLSWEWSKDPYKVQLFIACLLKASYQDGKKVKGTTLRRGQFVMGYREMAKELGWSPSTLVKHMNKLCETGELMKTPTPNGTIVTVVHWSRYQKKQRTNK